MLPPARASTAMVLRPSAKAVHPVLPPRSSKPSVQFVASQPSPLHNTASVFPSPSSSTHSLMHCCNSKTVFEYHQQHHCNKYGGIGGFKYDPRRKGRKNIFGLKAVFQVDEGLVYSKKAKKGLKFWLDNNSLKGGGGVRIWYAVLKQEDSLSKDQHQPSSNSSRSSAAHAAVTSESIMEGKSLWSKLGQSVNLSGVSFSARVIVKDRHLAIPHVSVPDISWIDWKALRTRGFEGVLFDKDNTLTAPYGLEIWPSLTDSLQECREVFGGRIALLSNSAGLHQYDPLGAEAKILESRLGIPVIRHGQKKPAGNALAVSDYFGCDPTLLIMVGDRYFTDVVFGNNNGLLTIRPAPLSTRGDPFMVKRVRVLEETLVDWWRRQGCLPPKHQLYDNPVDFIKDPGCW